MKEHKHAEILRAIADGKEVEMFFHLLGRWEVPQNPDMTNPITRCEDMWRVKPEPKPDFIVKRKVTFDSVDLFCAWDFDNANLKLTFDSENPHILKSAEVIK